MKSKVIIGIVAAVAVLGEGSRSSLQKWLGYSPGSGCRDRG